MWPKNFKKLKNKLKKEKVTQHCKSTTFQFLKTHQFYFLPSAHPLSVLTISETHYASIFLLWRWKGTIHRFIMCPPHSLPRQGGRREAPWVFEGTPTILPPQPSPGSPRRAPFSGVAWSTNTVLKSKSQLSPGRVQMKRCRPCLDLPCSLTEGLQTRNKAVKHHSHRDSRATNYKLQSLWEIEPETP